MAQCELAESYKTGAGLEKNEATAAYWWSLAAAQGLAEAQYALAVTCFFGEGAAKDQIKAFKLYCQAAEQGHADAIYKLGVMHMQGIATPKDAIAGKALYVYANSLGSEHARMPTFEIGEASRALTLATQMGQSGKVLDTLAAWRRNKADAAAAGERDLESEDVGVSMAQAKAARASAAKTRCHPGHLALLLGSLGFGLVWLLLPGVKPLVVMAVAAFLVLTGAYGVWRCARDLALSRGVTALLLLLALLPVIGMLVCLGMLLKVVWRRLA